jgi:ketosteroid isomerase-like protein
MSSRGGGSAQRTLEERQASNVAVVREAFDCFNRGGIPELLVRYDELFTDDFEFIPSIVGGLERRTYRGREGWSAWDRDRAEVLDDLHMSELAFEALGDAVVLVLSRLSGQGKASGVPLDVESGWVAELRDGRTARMRSFRSHEEARQEAQRAVASRSDLESAR